MGICNGQKLSSEEKKAEQGAKLLSSGLDKILVENEKEDRMISKILLLGPGESGKSTFFKQMTELYGIGFPEETRKSFQFHIYRNVIDAMQTLCEETDKKVEWKINPENNESKIYILNLGDEDEVTVDSTVGGHIQKLWLDTGIKLAYQNRSKFQLDDSAAYYFGRVTEIMKNDYVPTKQDVFRSRVATTGIVEETFVVDGHKFHIFDVGGQRSERRKWIHCFENVTAVLFIAAISVYDQMLYEDDGTNRMKEALTLFAEISNSKWFKQTSMILFLNKKDIFTEKIKVVPLGKTFPEYTGKNEFEPASEFIVKKFEKLSEAEQMIHTHITCATDSENIFVVFQAVKDIVIQNALARVGLT